MRTEKQVFRRFNIPAMMIFFFLFLFSVGLLVPHPAFADTNQGTVKMKQMDTRHSGFLLKANRVVMRLSADMDLSQKESYEAVLANMFGLGK